MTAFNDECLFDNRSRDDLSANALALLVQTASDAIICWNKDELITFWNQAAEDLIGYRPQEIIGKPLSLILGGSRSLHLYQATSCADAGECASADSYIELLALRRDGTRLPVELSLSSYMEGQEPVYCGIIRDLSVRKYSVEAYNRAHDFYLTLFDDFPALIWRSGLDAKCDYFNRSWLEFTGRCLQEEMGDGWAEGVHPDDFERCVRTYLAAFNQRQPFEMEYRLKRHDNQYRWIADFGRPFFDLDGSFAGYIGSCYDITDRKNQEEHLSYLASHDPLTGLYNRRTLEKALEDAISQARDGTTSALLYIDLDNFKLINDTLGHVSGDKTLEAVGRVLKEHLRSGDMLVRIGGDEFAVLLPKAGLEEARSIAERLRLSIDENHFVIGSHHFDLSLSIGVVLVDGIVGAEVMLAQADAAMYQAKRRGRNQVSVCLDGQTQLAEYAQANQLATTLKQALRENRFVLYYQPIVRLSTGEVDHYEALARLKDENGQIVLPNSFIPAIERFGLVPQFTRWVIHEVIETLARREGLVIYLNLSPQCLSDDDLIAFIEKSLEAHGVKPSQLGFEITETTMVQDFEMASCWIERLKGIGCRFALDDFGAGFSSFSHLKGLPVDELKINGDFIRVVETDPTHRALVEAMQTLAQVTGKEVVAEYVENEAIARVLLDLGVTFGQGYHLGAPSPLLPETDATGVEILSVIPLDNRPHKQRPIVRDTIVKDAARVIDDIPEILFGLKVRLMQKYPRRKTRDLAKTAG